MENAEIWNLIKEEMKPDGSLRDIYVLDSNLLDWKNLLQSLKSAVIENRFNLNEDEVRLDEVNLEEHFSGESEWRLPSLKLFQDGVQLNCHFFTEDEIEFDLDPKEITGEKKASVIFEFMKFLSGSTGKDSILTPENAKEYPILRFNAHKRELEYIPINELPEQ
jgi:hypothetical protein